ncbi:MAG TPA: hypothetical protein VMQ56_06100 [Terracidiphilus sp.]|jgi:hypothetical protein|nr:hypothetical protein [Terracidiphilus sp.]
MKGTPLALLASLLAAPLLQCAGEQLIPAGSLIQCTISEPKLSSKTTAIGDPVLCQLGHAERYGRSVLPLNSYLVGRFEDYKDPGHFVGKGWMELRFDRMVIEPNTEVPVDAKVVAVPGYNVDRDGRILGKGHLTRDIVLWSIPILWPVDLLMWPMRGPRPTLKEESRLTLKIMDDLGIPDVAPPQRDPYGLYQRQPSAEAAPPPLPYPPQQYGDAPPAQAEAGPMEEPAPAPEPPPAYSYAPLPEAPPAYAYASPPPPVYAYAPPPPPVYAYAAPPAGYGYGGGMSIQAYGGYAQRGYATPQRAYGYGGGYGGPARGSAYGGVQRGYAYHPAPRTYAYGSAPRVSGYGAGRMGGGYAAGRGAGIARGGGGRVAR